jgi:hypothetical protein
VSDTPNPGDYSAPTNWDALDPPSLPPLAHPSGQAPPETPSGPTPADDEPSETSAVEEVEDPQITPYPPAAPTIQGAELTQSVFQAGP